MIIKRTDELSLLFFHGKSNVIFSVLFFSRNILRLQRPPVDPGSVLGLRNPIPEVEADQRLPPRWDGHLQRGHSLRDHRTCDVSYR